MSQAEVAHRGSQSATQAQCLSAPRPGCWTQASDGKHRAPASPGRFVFLKLPRTLEGVGQGLSGALLRVSCSQPLGFFR